MRDRFPATAPHRMRRSESRRALTPARSQAHGQARVFLTELGAARQGADGPTGRGAIGSGLMTGSGGERCSGRSPHVAGELWIVTAFPAICARKVSAAVDNPRQPSRDRLRPEPSRGPRVLSPTPSAVAPQERGVGRSPPRSRLIRTRPSRCAVFAAATGATDDGCLRAGRRASSARG
jgi:hypothetical protein